MNPQERKGKLKNLTPYRPIGMSTKLDTTWSVSLLLWGTQFYSLLPMLKSSCTLNPKNPLFSIRLSIVLCFTQAGHFLCSGLKAGFYNEGVCQVHEEWEHFPFLPHMYTHTYKVRRKQSECQFPSMCCYWKMWSALLAI
jgi:hypothetical protein